MPWLSLTSAAQYSTSAQKLDTTITQLSQNASASHFGEGERGKLSKLTKIKVSQINRHRLLSLVSTEIVEVVLFFPEPWT